MYEGYLVRDKSSRIYQMRYYQEGRSANPHSKSTRTTNNRKAKNALAALLKEFNSGRATPESDKLTVGDLVKAYVDDQKTNGVKDWKKTEQRWLTHLAATFSDVKATSLTTRSLREFIKERQGEEIVVRSHLKAGGMLHSATGKFPSNATINLDLATLRGAYSLAKEDGDILIVPKFPTLPKGEERKDRLDEVQLRRLLEETSKEGLWLQTLILLWASYAWRRSEAVETLKVAQVDMDACADGEVVPRGRLNLTTTKNGDPRYVYLTRQLKPLIAACIAGKGPEEQVFTREDGSPIGDFRKRWERLCISIGAGKMVDVGTLKQRGLTLKHPKYEGLSVHGLRRTGCRLLRAAIGEAAAMRISGHHDVRVFRKHYDGEDDAVILSATQWLDAKYAKQLAEANQNCEGFVKDSQKQAEAGLAETPATVN